MKASVIDSFKLMFSDEYKVSDRDYKALSDTLVSKGLSEEALESGMVSLVKILIDNKIDFPMTMKYFKYLWENTYTSFKFLDMLSGLIKLGYLRLIKVSKDSAKNVLGNAYNGQEFNAEDLSDGKVIIIEGTAKLGDAVNIFKSVMTDRRRITESYMREVNESMVDSPSYVKDFITRLTTRYLKEYKIIATLESYVDEDTKESLSIIFKNVSDYTLKDKDIKKLADKYIKKVSMVNDLDAYKESSSELYLGLEVDKSKDYKSLLDPIYKFIGDLEINGVA